MSVVKNLSDTHGNVITIDEKGKESFSNETILLKENLYGTNDHGSLIIIGRPGTPVSKQLLQRGLKNGSLSYSAETFSRTRRRQLAQADKKKLTAALGNIEAQQTADDKSLVFTIMVDASETPEDKYEKFVIELTEYVEKAKATIKRNVEKIAGKVSDDDDENILTQKGTGEEVKTDEVKPFMTTKAHVTAAQIFLVEQKFFEGEVSGKMTDDFREAVRVWQAKNSLEETGTLNQVTFESMKIELEKSE